MTLPCAVPGTELGDGEGPGGEGDDGRDECADECADEVVPGTDTDAPDSDAPDGEPGLEAAADPWVGPGPGPAPELSAEPAEPAETVPETSVDEPAPFI